MMLNADRITFSYDKDKPLFENFSLVINKNDHFCLFGDSGCGKTTLLRILMGLEMPQSGTVSGISRLAFSVVFQEDRLLPFKTVLENILITGAEMDIALEHLKALGISDTKDKYPDTLSGGMRRRVAIVRALSARFDILLLDEPFNGLDGDNLISAASHILKTLGSRPLVMVTHSKEEARLLGAKIINI